MVDLMEVHIKFRGMDHSDAIEAYVGDKFAKLESFIKKEEKEPINVDIVLTAARTHHHHEVEVHMRAAHYSFTVKRENSDLYQAIDKVMDIAYREMQKDKQKQVDSIKEDNQFRKI